MEMREKSWKLLRDANRVATEVVEGIVKKIEREDEEGSVKEMDSMRIEEIVRMRRELFKRQIELYRSMRLDLEGLKRCVNDERKMYNDVKRYVYSTFNVMWYPRICAQLYEERDDIASGRTNVMELLIDNLMEKFEMYKSDTFDNM